MFEIEAIVVNISCCLHKYVSSQYAFSETAHICQIQILYALVFHSIRKYELDYMIATSMDLCSCS
jgi:hypothetical protein